MKNKKNKLVAMILLGLSLMILWLAKDATMFVVAAPISLLLLVSKRNWID